VALIELMGKQNRVQQEVEKIQWTAVFERLGFDPSQENVDYVLWNETSYPFSNCATIIAELKALKPIAHTTEGEPRQRDKGVDK